MKLRITFRLHLSFALDFLGLKSVGFAAKTSKRNEKNTSNDGTKCDSRCAKEHTNTVTTVAVHGGKKLCASGQKRSSASKVPVALQVGLAGRHCKFG